MRDWEQHWTTLTAAVPTANCRAILDKCEDMAAMNGEVLNLSIIALMIELDRRNTFVNLVDPDDPV